MPKDHMEKLYSSKNELVRYVHIQRLNQIVQLIPKNAKNLLDIGCGEGQLLERIEYAKHGDKDILVYSMNNSNLKTTGIDITKVAIESAKKRCKQTKIIKADFNEYDFKEEKFDIIICTEVLEHIINYKETINRMKELLTENGTLIISFPNERNLTIGRFFLNRKPPKVVDHVNSFNPKQMQELVGLKLEQQQAIPRTMPFFLCITWIMKFKK